MKMYKWVKSTCNFLDNIDSLIKRLTKVVNSLEDLFKSLGRLQKSWFVGLFKK